MNKPDGIFENGDLYYGEKELDEGKWWFTAHSDGGDYQTQEIPETFPLFSMIIFPDGSPESEATEYFLAKKLGDSRFGSACKHERSKRGYCPDCLRKVI